MDFSPLDSALDKYKNVKGSLISILQEAQDIYGCVPSELIAYIAEKTGEKPAKIEGVATFYTQFRSEPAGKYLIMLCQGTACHVNGSHAIYNALVTELGIADKGTTPDKMFTLINVACLGCCSLSPAMSVNGETYGNLTPESAVEIIKNIGSNADK